VKISVAFATVAHFAKAAVSAEPGSQLPVYSSLADVAERLGLQEERRKAEDFIRAARALDDAQLSFDALIEQRLKGVHE
jgi:hypothetical protein